MGKPRPLFCLFSSVSQHDDKLSIQYETKGKRQRFCAWDSNPGLQNERTVGADEYTELRLLSPLGMNIFAAYLWPRRSTYTLAWVLLFFILCPTPLYDL